jgi:glutamyl-tRNA reductase
MTKEKKMDRAAVVAVGLNHRSVPLELLEPMTVSDAYLPKALHDLCSRDHLSEAVVLSTCMRTEIYAVADGFHGAMADIRNFLTEWSGSQPEEFADYVYSFYGEGAITHLFQVASGVDSAILGEGEIIRQVGDAWQLAQQEDSAGPTLSRLFRHALEVGKRARSETAIARGTTSLSHAAVSMAAERLGGLQDQRILIVGAGEVGEGIARALASVPGIGEILVSNRTWSKAAALAERVGGRPLELNGLMDALQQTDLLLTSTGAPNLMIEADDLAAVLPARRGRPLLIVDIAVPRDVDPTVGDLDGVTLLNMDDLKAFADRGMAQRRQELGAVNQIIADEVERFLQLTAHREVAPVVTALRDRAEQLRQAELSRHAAKLAGLGDRERAAVESVTRGLLAKLLHEPTVRLKAATGSGRGEQLADAVRILFDL